MEGEEDRRGKKSLKKKAYLIGRKLKLQMHFFTALIIATLASQTV